MKPALEELERRLQTRFPDARLSLSDDSHLHAGHAGSAGGAGHFTVDIVSGAFVGLSRVARHRLVYDAVADWMPHRIHALIVRAALPAESAAAPTPAASTSAALAPAASTPAAAAPAASANPATASPSPADPTSH